MAKLNPPSPPDENALSKDEIVGAVAIDPQAVLKALQQLTPEQLTSVLQQGRVIPTTMGMSPDQLQTIVQTATRDSAKSMQLSMRHENPNYPDKSVFLPRGRFDNEGNQQVPKTKLRYDTFYCNVLIGWSGNTSDTNTEEEIELFNRFDKDCESRGGTWTARFVKRGSRKALFVDFPHRNNDDRVGLPPMPEILLELLEGQESVNPSNLLAQVKASKAEIEFLKTKLEQIEKAERALAPSDDDDIVLPVEKMEDLVNAGA